MMNKESIALVQKATAAADEALRYVALIDRELKSARSTGEVMGLCAVVLSSAVDELRGQLDRIEAMRFQHSELHRDCERKEAK